jgi:beta-lactamase class A
VTVSRIALAFVLVATSAAAWAQAPVSPAFRAKAEALVALFRGRTVPEQLFSKAFLAQVPAAQVNAISKQLNDQLGQARAVSKIEARSTTTGSVILQFERGTLQLNLAVAAAAPHPIEGLLITGTELKGDSLAGVAMELKALPGQTSFAVAKLGSADPLLLASNEPGRAMAIGSAFKLFLLAELSRSVAAGERKWSDVARLDRRSLPSGFLQTWPKGAPLTFYSLAALMISQSDNSATDTLLHALGREKVEALLPTLGIKAAERNRPFLATMEAFALKAGPNAEARNGWPKKQEAERRSMLPSLAATPPDGIDPAKLTGAPNAIETVEWFASAEDLVRTMDWLRRNGGPEALEILAINPGIGSGMASQYDYLGYKGGSEVGVINMTFLVRSKAGGWHAVSGSWNNPKAPVDEQKFGALMTRAVSQLR